MIIAGFLGVGKSSLERAYPRAFKDIDSSLHAYLKDGTKNPNFIRDYFEHIKQESGNYHILTSTHVELLELFKKHDMEYVVVIPDIDLKDVYIERYKARGNTDDFIQKLYNNWEFWISRLMKENDVIVLKENQNLIDKIKFDKDFDPRDMKLNDLMKMVKKHDKTPS